MRRVARLSLPSLTRTLREVAAQGKDPRSVFVSLAPELAAQMERDAGQRALLNAWGLSRNFDDHALRRIVDPKVLRLIGALTKTSKSIETLSYGSPPISIEAMNAGVLHTYGYLLSNVKTRFGFKRSRWVSAQLDRRLGLPASTLSPYPRGGTLLSNLTWVLASVALEGPERDELRGKLASVVSDRLAMAPLPACEFRLIEEVALGRGETRRDYRIQTAVVPLDSYTIRDRRGDDGWLLVYSLSERTSGEEPKQSLYTAFPINAAGRDELRRAPTGRVDVALRYNAQHPMFGAEVRRGNRSIEG